MTLVSLAIGLLRRAVLPVRPAPPGSSSARSLFLTHSILDGCDGELARLKFLESPRGARLDFWGDNVVHVAVFGCMAAGLEPRRRTRRCRCSWAWPPSARWPWPLPCSSGTGLQPRPPGSEATARVVDALANRDFIYLVLAALDGRTGLVVRGPRGHAARRSSSSPRSGPTAPGRRR